MAKRSRVVVDNTTTEVETIEASNVTVASLEDSNSNVAINDNEDPFWDNVKMADFRFAMRVFCNGNAQGIAISWRGLVAKLLALKDSDKQVFVTVFENSGQKYNITLRMRVVLSDKGVGYSLCSLLEHLMDKPPQGIFVRVDIRDTLGIDEVLGLLRTRFPRPDKPNKS